MNPEQEEEAHGQIIELLISRDIGLVEEALVSRDHDNIQGALERLAAFIRQMPPEDRLRSLQPRLGGTVARILREPWPRNDVHEAAFSIILAALRMTITEREDPGNLPLFTYLVDELGILDIIKTKITPPFPNGDNVAVRALVPLTNFTLVPEVAPAVCASGIVPHLIQLARTRVCEFPAVYSLIALANIAIHPVSHSCLLDSGAIPLATELLSLLQTNETDFYRLDCGLSASFIICRLVGTHEQGSGAAAIHENRVLLDRLHWLLTLVLKAGPEGRVIGSSWNPANIVMDIATLAKSDRNKPKLSPFVELIVSVWTAYPTNKRLVHFAVKALHQMMFDESCRSRIIEFSLFGDLSLLLMSIKSESTVDLQTMQLAEVILHQLPSRTKPS